MEPKTVQAWIALEWEAMSSAPTLFAIAIGLVGFVIWRLVSWVKSSQLEGLREQIEAHRTWREQAEAKLGAATITKSELDASIRELLQEMVADEKGKTPGNENHLGADRSSLADTNSEEFIRGGSGSELDPSREIHILMDSVGRPQLRTHHELSASKTALQRPVFNFLVWMARWIGGARDMMAAFSPRTVQTTSPGRPFVIGTPRSKAPDSLNKPKTTVTQPNLLEEFDDKLPKPDALVHLKKEINPKVLRNILAHATASNNAVNELSQIFEKSWDPDDIDPPRARKNVSPHKDQDGFDE